MFLSRLIWDHFQPQFREALGPAVASDSDENVLKADIERLMTQAKFEAVLIAERNLERYAVSGWKFNRLGRVFEAIFRAVFLGQNFGPQGLKFFWTPFLDRNL